MSKKWHDQPRISQIMTLIWRTCLQRTELKPIFMKVNHMSSMFTLLNVYLSKTLWSYWMSSLIGGFINFTWFSVCLVAWICFAQNIKSVYPSVSLKPFTLETLNIFPNQKKKALILHSWAMLWVVMNISCSASHRTVWLSVSSESMHLFICSFQNSNESMWWQYDHIAQTKSLGWL